MKKETKIFLEDFALVFVALIALLCGCISIDIGQVAKGIFLIMCSLYIAMWVHAGLIGATIVNRLEDIRKQEGQEKDATTITPKAIEIERKE